MIRVSYDLDRMQIPKQRAMYYNPDQPLKFSYAYPDRVGITEKHEIEVDSGWMTVDNVTPKTGNIATGFFPLKTQITLKKYSPILHVMASIGDVELRADEWLRAGLVASIRKWDGTKWLRGNVNFSEMYIEFDFYRSPNVLAKESPAGIIEGGDVIEYRVCQIQAPDLESLIDLTINLNEAILGGHPPFDSRYFGQTVIEYGYIYCVYVVLEAWNSKGTVKFRNLRVVC